MTNELQIIIIVPAVQNSRWETSIVNGLCRIFSLSLFCHVLFSAPKLAADFLKKQELRKAKSEGTKTVINIGSPVCFQEFFGILETVNTQANYTLQSQKTG
jgi:hypothetical protein